MEERQEAIERYLMNRMDQEERSDFEKTLREDPDLAEALAIQRDLMLGIQAHFDEALRSRLKLSEDSSDKNEAKVVRMQSRAIWRWAGAAALALVLVGVFYMMNQGNKSDRLFAQYYDSFPNIVEFQQRDEPSNITEAFILYQTEQWEQAHTAFQGLREQSDEIYPVFYQAICAMNLGFFEQAARDLIRVKSSQDSRFAGPANWYLALTYLADGQVAKCRQVLIEISTSPGNYREDAKNLLAEIG